MSDSWDRWRRGATDAPHHHRRDRVTRQPWWFRACLVALLGLVTLFTGANGSIFDGISVAFASPAGAHAQRPSDSGTPNRFDPKSHATSTPRPTQGPGPSSASTIPGGTPVHMPHQKLFSMRQGALPLHAHASAHFDGSDGRLSVDVPAGAVTDAELAAADGGTLGLRITQIAPASGSSAGGSGLVSFGSYLIQVVDGQGVLVKHGLHKPVTLTLHYGNRDSALDLSRAFVVFNGALPNGVDVAPLAAATNEPAVPGTRNRTTRPSSGGASAISPNGDVNSAAIGLGPTSSQLVTFNAKQRTLTVQPLISTPSTSLSWNTNAAVASFGKPDPFNVDLSGGSLSAGYPIDLPAGPGGLTPPVSLSYSSAGVAENHGPQAAAGWAGEGWNVGLGAISWAEHNVTSSCASTCGNTWEDSWQLSDPFGTGAELIPPNINVATYWDDSPFSITPSPVQWHTAPETHAKIYSYVGPVNPPDSANTHTPCFRVFLTNGIMEEFGCTNDSLEYYYTPGNGDYIANWNLDLITDPQGNQIHITYQQDTEQKNVSGTNHTYIRDAVLSTIEYDSPGCRNAQTACTGAAWAPLVRVNFAAGHSPTRLTNTPANCNTGTNLRCDDPKDLSGSSGLGVPDVQSTFVLNDIQVQVRSSGTGSWNTLKDYQLKYEQNGPVQITDPSTGKAESSAGRLLLKNLIQVGDDGTTALPTRSFGYTQVTEYYEDDLFHPNPTTNCGPSWNTGNGSGCILWSQNHDNNSWFLNAADNGLGLHQDFAWALARNNTHKTNGNVAANNANPFYCNGVTGYPCNEADDQNWSRVVLTSETSSVVRAASTGNTTVSSTTSYSYLLKTSLAAQECSDCGVDMYWGNINDGDYLDYYNAKFMGFAETDVTQPDGAKDAHKFLTTDGYGVYDTSQVGCFAATQPVGSCGNDAWWRLDNVGHGREYETDSYNTNGTTLLKKTVSQYRALCPASNVSGTPAWTGTPNYGNWNGNLVSELDHNNPVASCDVQLSQSFDYDIEGSSAGSTAPTVATIYSYDSYGRPSVTSTRSNGEPGLVTVEAETATVVSAGAPTSVVNNCCNILWSNGAERVLQATATGQALTLSFSVPSAGTYNVIGLLVKSSDNGISSLAIDGTTVGGTFDGYNNPAIMAQPFGYGQVTLSAGTHQAKWTATGKNASSSNYAISIDALILQKTGTSPGIGLSKPAYIYNDAVTATSSGATGTYLIESTAFSDNEDTFGNRYSCSYTSYDGQAYATGQQGTLTLGEATKADTYTNCGTPPSYTPSGLIETTHTYDAWGNAITSKDPDANAGVSGHVGCTVNTVQYTTCDAFDSTFETLPTSSSNALNQTESTSYGTPAASNGFGLWPISTTDANGQTTSQTYDALGRMTGTTLPGETTGLTTQSWSYADWCVATGAQAPCLEVDQIQRLDSGTTVTARAFYDGFGQLVETRGTAPGGQDVVRYAYYDAAGHITFISNSYFVPAYTGGPGAAAFATPDASQVGSTTSYDGLERALSVTDPLSHTTTSSYSVACNLVSADGSSCYVQMTAIDTLNHQHISYKDALGQNTYDDRFTGNSSGTYALYALTRYAYDFNGHLVTITHPNNTTTTTFTYDAAGRKTGMTDPDIGSPTYTYDANGNAIQAVDARGAAGTVYVGYDGINRALWRNTTNSSTGAYETFSYDSTANGNVGIGRLTSETFTGGPNNSLSGSYNYVYDTRGQQTSSTLSVAGNNYTTQTSFDDAGNILSQTYPNGEVVANSYTSGWLLGVTTTQGSTTTTLLSNAAYAGASGAAHQMTGATLGGGTYTYNASFDALTRPTDLKLTRTSDSALLFEQTRTLDAGSNVTSTTTTLPSGTVNQAFCYDEQDRLTWASSASGTIPCGGTNTAGTLAAANYTQSFAFDNLGRLTSGPAGSYTYGDSAHLHAATAIGSTWTASYDAAGNMTCRAPITSTTCSGTPTGQQLSYDTEGSLASWQNTPTSPSTTDGFLYDGQGNRVEQQVTTGLPGSPTTTTTIYIGSIEEVAISGASTTTTTYYYAGTTRIGESVNGTIAYLASDALGSANLALDASGIVTATQLFDPYGNVLYSNGAMPTDYGFTGQHSDSTTGLDYYNARYYDPVAAQFTSADTILPGDGADPWGLSRYAYVEGNPIGRVDPTGHCPWCIAAVVGAVVGGAISAGSQIVNSMQHGQSFGDAVKHVDLVEVGKAALIGAVVGATGGAAGAAIEGALAGTSAAVSIGGAIVGGAAVGAGEGALGQIGDNVLHGRNWSDDVGQAAIFGAVTGGIGGGAGAIARRYGGRILKAAAKAFGGGCGGESFSPDTPVDTPNGEQAISTLKVGDRVVAYDPQTGKPGVQTVEHTFINHDTDLLDVTLRVSTSAPAKGGKAPAVTGTAPGAAPAAMGGASQSAHATNNTPAPDAPATSNSHTELVHSTAHHPWYTGDHGWLPAGFLKVGEPVLRVDGTTATVVAIRTASGTADMWDLTVSNVHTFAVGAGHYVVHNSNVCSRASAKTFEPGPYAGRSILARGPKKLIGRFTTAERDAIDEIGNETGCHTCGTRNPGAKHWIPDHQPPDELNYSGGPQRLYPHCLACSRSQGANVGYFNRVLKWFFAR